jgi:hypothetical protein
MKDEMQTLLHGFIRGQPGKGLQKIFSILSKPVGWSLSQGLGEGGGDQFTRTFKNR